MIVRIVISAKPIEKDEIRSLVEFIRRWEHTTRGEVIGILIQTEDTQLTQTEITELCGDIYPISVLKAAETQSDEPDKLLHLGSRGVSVDGKLVGICEGLTLTLGNEVTDEEIAALQKCRAIMLTRMGQG